MYASVMYSSSVHMEALLVGSEQILSVILGVIVDNPVVIYNSM